MVRGAAATWEAVAVGCAEAAPVDPEGGEGGGVVAEGGGALPESPWPSPI
jgi:hypothetical protein